MKKTRKESISTLAQKRKKNFYAATIFFFIFFSVRFYIFLFVRPRFTADLQLYCRTKKTYFLILPHMKNFLSLFQYTFFYLSFFNSTSGKNFMCLSQKTRLLKAFFSPSALSKPSFGTCFRGFLGSSTQQTHL